jgi:hypothetical protein
MSAQGPVLRDIHLPPEPSWWPPAPGWWIVAGIVVVFAIWASMRIAKQRRLQRARNVLHRELESLRDAHPATSDAAAQVAAMSMLLRRAAKRYEPSASSLRDEAWLVYLDADDPAQPFSRGPGRVLLDGPYRPQLAADEADALAQAVRARLDRFVSATHV